MCSMFFCVEMFAWCMFLLWWVCASIMCVLVWSVICVEYVYYLCGRCACGSVVYESSSRGPGVLLWEGP